MIKDLLRFPVPDQIKALLEKIDALDSEECTSSLGRYWEFSAQRGINLYERWLIRRAIRAHERRRAMTMAMEIVLNTGPFKSDVPLREKLVAALQGQQAQVQQAKRVVITRR